MKTVLAPFNPRLPEWRAAREVAEVAGRWVTNMWPRKAPHDCAYPAERKPAGLYRLAPGRKTPRLPTTREHAAREHGFSLIEQIVAVGLVAVIVPSLALLLSGLVRQASSSEAQVKMMTLARSQLESVKQQPYTSTPALYAAISPVPEEYAITTTIQRVKTFRYPAPSSAPLPDEIQFITVAVSCLDCTPPVSALTLQGYKVRR